MSPAALGALRRARERSPRIGDAWVLAAPADRTKPCSRHQARHWWERAEALGELEHVPGLGWHGLRRKFSTDLQEAPLKLLCELGGWKEPQTLLTCYQHPTRGRSERRCASEMGARFTARGSRTASVG